MNSNPINEGACAGRIEATDDVEAHAANSRHIDGPDTDDVEAHAANSRHIDGPDTDDVEAHAVRVKVEAGEDDDTEGHGMRGKF